MKDRARPFSRKHRRYWLTVTGGMILIMGVNVALGWWVYSTSENATPAAKYEPLIPLPIDAGADAPTD